MYTNQSDWIFCLYIEGGRVEIPINSTGFSFHVGWFAVWLEILFFMIRRSVVQQKHIESWFGIPDFIVRMEKRSKLLAGCFTFQEILLKYHQIPMQRRMNFQGLMMRELQLVQYVPVILSLDMFACSSHKNNLFSGTGVLNSISLRASTVAKQYELINIYCSLT